MNKDIAEALLFEYLIPIMLHICVVKPASPRPKRKPQKMAKYGL